MTVLRMGFDAVQIDRMEKKLKGEAFCRRAFSEEENALFARKKHPAPTAAANFAAKEALAKALRCGIFGFDLQEAPVLRREDGSPYFAFSGELARRSSPSPMRESMRSPLCCCSRRRKGRLVARSKEHRRRENAEDDPDLRAGLFGKDNLCKADSTGSAGGAVQCGRIDEAAAWRISRRAA